MAQYLLNGQESARLLYRKIQDDDFTDWLEFFHDPQTHQHWTPPQNPPEIECAVWYKKQHWRYANNMGGMNALIEKQSQRLIGHAGLLLQTVDNKTELEIAYSLLPEFWNQGYATEAAKTCGNFAFANRFSDSVISIISKTNIASQRVAIKNNMKALKETRYHDNDVFIFSASFHTWWR